MIYNVHALDVNCL